MPNPLNVPITPPRVAFIDPRTNTVSREWYMFFMSLFHLTGGSSQSLNDLQKESPPLTVDELTLLIDQAVENFAPSQDGVLEQITELRKDVDALNTQPRDELGTMSEQNADNVRITGGSISGVNPPLPVASGGTGQSVFTDGQLLIGNSSGSTLTPAVLTAGANITVTNGAGSITVSVSGLGTMAFENTGASGSFLTADLKTVTVVDGIITSIV